MPALLEPPPTRSRVRKDIVSQPPPRDSRWNERFVRSGYFFGAVLLHLVIFALVATYVVFQTPPTTPDQPFQQIKIPPAPKPLTPPTTVSVGPPIAPPVSANSSEHLLATTIKNPSGWVVPIPVPGNSVGPGLPHPGIDFIKTNFNTTGPSANRVGTIRKVEIEKWGRTPESFIEGGSDPSSVVAKFKVYVASYADGDWACNSVIDGQGHIVAGALPNLLAKVREWSHGHIQAQVEPQPLSIGSPDLLAKMPPFIFFTGHKDFRLTQAEVDNLKAYVQNGGLIWGDNALPGSGSRFDVAFHREMRRVIPDKDKPFEDVPMSHEMFNENKWFDFDGQLPSGMNYFQEPMQHIDLDGYMAILYTPNDYSDMMFMRILPGDKAYEGGWHRGLTLWSSEEFLNNDELFFRNFDLPACYQSQRLGANIIGYLLVRFDRLMLLMP